MRPETPSPRPRTRLAGLPPSHPDGPAHAQPGGTDAHPYGYVETPAKDYALDLRLTAGGPTSA